MQDPLLLRRAASIALLAQALAACTGAPVLPAPSAAHLALEKCGIANQMEPVLCGDLPVPENREHPERRTISLNVVVIPATGTKTQPPLYFLAGGPGIAGTGGASFFMTDGSAYREHRDIVLLDQRGTGGSHPLDCPVGVHDPWQPVLDPPTVADCRDRLAPGADLAHYSTAESVQDLEALRVALGHDRIDVNGLSYGTRLAQEYLRAYPGHVRAMVLLGTLSPEDKLPLSWSRSATEVLDRLAQQCAEDPACHKAVPDLARDVASLRDKLAKGPLTVRTKSGRKARLEAGPFWEAIRAQLITTASQRRLPWRLHEAARGRFDALLDAIAPQADHAAMGLLLAIACPEDTLHITDDEVAALTANVFGTYRLAQQRAACRAWGVPATPEPRPGFVDSGVPTLLMAGDMDYVTPVDQARAVAAHLSSSRVVVVPNLGHFPDGLSNMDCYDRVIRDFLAAGSAASLDLSCIATMQPPPFQTKADAGP